MLHRRRQKSVILTGLLLRPMIDSYRLYLDDFLKSNHAKNFCLELRAAFIFVNEVYFSESTGFIQNV